MATSILHFDIEVREDTAPYSSVGVYLTDTTFVAWYQADHIFTNGVNEPAKGTHSLKLTIPQALILNQLTDARRNSHYSTLDIGPVELTPWTQPSNDCSSLSTTTTKMS